MSYTVDLEQLEDEEVLWNILEILGKKLNRKGKECIFLVSGKNNEAVMSWTTELGGYFLSTYPKWSSMFQDFCNTGEMPMMKQQMLPGELANYTALKNVEQFKTFSKNSSLKNTCKWLQRKDNSMFSVKDIKIKVEGDMNHEEIKHSYKDVKIKDNSQHSDEYNVGKTNFITSCLGPSCSNACSDDNSHNSNEVSGEIMNWNTSCTNDLFEGANEVIGEMTDCNTSYSNVLIEDNIQGSLEVSDEMTNFNTVCSNVLNEDNIQGSIGVGREMTNCNTICSNVLTEDNIECANEVPGRWKEYNMLYSNVLKEKLKDIIHKRTHLNNSVDNCTFRNVSTSKAETDHSYVLIENNIETGTDQQGSDNSQNKDKKRKKGSGDSRKKYKKRKKSTRVSLKCIPILPKKIDDNACTVQYFRYGGIIQNSTTKEACTPLTTEVKIKAEADYHFMDKTSKQNLTTKEACTPCTPLTTEVKIKAEADNRFMVKTSKQNLTTKESLLPLMTDVKTKADVGNLLMVETIKQNSTTKETVLPLTKIMKNITEAKNHLIDKTSKNDEKWKMSPTTEPLLPLSTVVLTKIDCSKFPTKEEQTKNFVKENMMIHVPPEILADQVVSDSYRELIYQDTKAKDSTIEHSYSRLNPDLRNCAPIRYSCKLCTKKFDTLQSYYNHTNSHTVCNLSCGSCINVIPLQNKKLEDFLSLECFKCGRKCGHVSLNSCFLCEKKAETKEALREHLKKVHCMYVCTECYRYFIDRTLAEKLNETFCNLASSYSTSSPHNDTSSNSTSCLDIHDISASFTGNSASCFDVSESSLQEDMNCSLVKEKAEDFADNHDNKGNNHEDKPYLKLEIESLPNATEKGSGKNENENGFQLNQDLEEEKRLLVISEKDTAHMHNQSKICKFCSMKFSNTFSYHQHLTSFHRSKFNTKCIHCDVIFSSSRSLSKHMSIHIPSNEMPYRCDVCGKGLFSEKSLKQHNCVHKVKNRPEFMCEICGRSYHYNKTLDVHKKYYHTNGSVGTYKCGNCRTLFYSRLKLNIHQSACKPHELCDVFQQTCRACGQYFKEQSALNLHMKKAHPFLCFFCGKNFKFCVSFENHMKRHTSDQQFPCKLCSAKYYEENLLDIHMKKTHGHKGQASSNPDTNGGSDDFRIAGYHQGCKILRVS